MISKIFISQNRERVIENLKKKYSNYKLFLRDEFKINDAKEVIEEAYISENREKYLIISAKSFNIYAQNRLLKILEEPPKNIIFFIVGTSKSIFLPTILSRMVIEEIKEEKKEYQLEIDLNNLTLSSIFTFIKKNRFISKEELKSIIENLLREAIKIGIEFSEDDLENFKIAIELASLNSKPTYLLSDLLLTIYINRIKEN